MEPIIFLTVSFALFYLADVLPGKQITNNNWHGWNSFEETVDFVSLCLSKNYTALVVKWLTRRSQISSKL